MGWRAGLINKNKRYGTLFHNDDIPILYTGLYREEYITNSIKRYVQYGEWDEDEIFLKLNIRFSV